MRQTSHNWGPQGRSYFRKLQAEIAFVSEHRMKDQEAANMKYQLQTLGWRASATEGKKAEVGIS